MLRLHSINVSAFAARALWQLLGSYSSLSDGGRYLTSLLHFLHRIIDAGVDQCHQELVDALGVLFGTKLFVAADKSDCILGFDNVTWETVDKDFFDRELRKTPFEIVVSFLTSVVQNVPEVFRRLQPLVKTMVEATKLSQSGNSYNNKF